MRIGIEAMEAAWGELHGLNYSTQLVSLYESFLTAKWLVANGRYPDPDINAVDEAVGALFVIDPTNEEGRVYPFRWGWRSARQPGRKTVWNNTTRGPKLATRIFNADDIRRGLREDAAQIVHDALVERPLPSWQALACLLLRNYEFGDADGWDRARALLISTLALSEPELGLVTSPAALGPSLLGGTEWSLADLPDALGPPTTVTITPPAGTTKRGSEEMPEPVTVEARVERMLRRTMSSYPCVLLVGPPGTGKGVLVRWAAAEAKASPGAFGFTPGLDPNPMWRTPDESWSSFELVGGLAPDSAGELRWSHGLLPTCLRENRWLVLDETNRADMDKIMGPLLTWLSVQKVEIGRTTAHGGDPIEIGWGTAPESEAFPSDEPTTFLAGRDWRLIGTYNPQDAQRVFRFGQALSRRFVTVPIPALEVGQFEALLADRYPDLPEEAAAIITGLYSAHRSSEATVLGPAVFLRLAEYLDPLDGPLGEMVAEAYVVSLGKYLGAYDDQVFAALRERVVVDEEALSEPDWEWIERQRLILG